MPTLRTPHCSYSTADGLLLNAPRGWKELTQDQLRYVFFVLSTFTDPVTVKTYMFLRFTGLEVVRKIAGGITCRLEGDSRRRKFNISTWQIQSLLHQFD